MSKEMIKDIAVESAKASPPVAVVTTSVAYLAFAWGARRLSPTAAGVGTLAAGIGLLGTSAWLIGSFSP